MTFNVEPLTSSEGSTSPRKVVPNDVGSVVCGLLPAAHAGHDELTASHLGLADPDAGNASTYEQGFKYFFLVDSSEGLASSKIPDEERLRVSEIVPPGFLKTATLTCTAFMVAGFVPHG